MSAFLFVYITVPSSADASLLARTLVEEKLAACVNLISGMRSFYVWEGKTVEDHETILIAKTKSDLFEGLSARVKELHPAEVPCIVAWPLERGLPDFFKWIEAGL